MPLPLLCFAIACSSLLGLLLYAYFKFYRLNVHHALLIKQIEKTRHALDKREKEFTALEKRVTSLQIEKEVLVHKLSTQERLAEQNHAKLHLQFETLSQKLLEEKSAKFTHLNKQEIEKILNPLSEKIKTFEQEVVRTHREAMDHKVALRTEIAQMHTLNQRMSQEASNLTQAIKGDNRLQGAWGEMILERLLESAGLVKGREYRVQTSFQDGEGKRKQPDIILQLPQKRNVVIDAKVSLKDYEVYFHGASSSTRESALHKHLTALKKHVKNLHSKNYAQSYDLQSLDFVLMFIPLEPAFNLALQKDPTLFQEAYHHNVILVSPSTLLATLRTIAHLWQREQQSQYASEIAQQSGALYDKFVSFVEDLRKVGIQLASTEKVYQSALNKLSEGRGNLISKAARIKALGARTKKTMKELPIQPIE